MFAISHSKVSAAKLLLGSMLCMYCTTENSSACAESRIGAKATEGELGSAVSLLSAQVSQGGLPQDKEVIEYIKRNKRVDFIKLFPSNWEAICFSGEYQHPLSDIKYELGKDFSSCLGSYSHYRDSGLQAISIIWSNKCRIIEIPTSNFYIEHQNGTSCYERNSIKEFHLQQSPVGIILVP
ncbi:hypothetical protein AB4Y85_04435 [Microvirga sp. 2YAF29]|uniref:hypothetical protein n=1 Tax=Microvirga sp. 2YAF29 TaxID=3233031 RepID=UPI003F9779A0